MDYILILHPDGDISINQYSMTRPTEYKCVYHKSYNPDETIKDNLIKAYEEWEELNNEKRI